jgi:aspartate aminotransferase-like enzyme
LARSKEITPRTLYLNLGDYLSNQERGQLPYTPAIGLLLQLHQRLLDIQQHTLPKTVSDHAGRASEFRQATLELPFSILPARQSNAMTALTCDDMDAVKVVSHLQTHFAIEVAPSGGALKHKLIRISHMGEQSSSDTQQMVSALAGTVQSQLSQRSLL